MIQLDAAVECRDNIIKRQRSALRKCCHAGRSRKQCGNQHSNVFSEPFFMVTILFYIILIKISRTAW